MTLSRADRTRSAPEVLRLERARVAQHVGDLRIELDGIIEASAGANLDDEHDPDGSTVGFERARVAALLDVGRRRLDALDEALARAATEEYGVCVSCGSAIPRDRLDALPATTTCVGCAGSDELRDPKSPARPNRRARRRGR